MKKYIIALFASLFLMLSLPVYAYEANEIDGIAVINTENLNVRSGPSKEYDKIGTLKKDTMVRVTGFVDPDWYIIEYGGTEGFIHKDYIIFTPEEVNEAAKRNFFMENAVFIVGGAIVLVVITMGITLFRGGRKEEDVEEEDCEFIPMISHEDTNMHLGEVSYDTYRLDIDPIYFEQTTVLPQPESIYEELGIDSNLAGSNNSEKNITMRESGNKLGKEERTSEEKDNSLKPDSIIQEEYHSLDMKLEEATAQIAALQKEVEELKKYKS